MNWFSHLTCSHAMAVILGVYLAIGIGWASIKQARTNRKRITLARLNSPFFRSVTDSYYRAGKLQ